MSRKHKRNHPEIAKPTVESSTLVTTFGSKVGVEMKTTNDLMNWIIFGDATRTFNVATNPSDF